MRVILPLLLLLVGCAPPAGSERRGGIVSLNPCADQLLVELAPPGRIAAISHYSHDPGATSLPLTVARRFPATAGTAEEVLALHPDLVLASSFTPAATREAFRRAGLNTLYLNSPVSLDDSKVQIAEVARAVGGEAKGAAMIARIDAAVATTRWTGRPAPALLYISGDMVNGSGTLLDAMMRIAGFRNVAADLGLAYTGSLPLEALVQRPPELILAPDDKGRGVAMRRRLLATTHARPREAVFSSALINCGGPTIPSALDRMAQIRREIGQ